MFFQPKDPSDPSNTQMTRAWPVLCAMYTWVAGGSGKLCQIISLRGLTVPNPGSQSVLRLWNEIHTRLPARCAWSALSCCNLAQSKNIKSFPAVELRLVASTPFTSAKVIAAQLECSTTISTRPPSTGAVVLLSGHFGKYTFEKKKEKEWDVKGGGGGVASYWYCLPFLDTASYLHPSCTMQTKNHYVWPPSISTDTPRCRTWLHSCCSAGVLLNLVTCLPLTLSRNRSKSRVIFCQKSYVNYAVGKGA